MSSLTANDIEELIANPDWVTLAAQPIVDLHRGTVTGYELLARFPQRASPERILEAASMNGLGAELEAIIVQRALELARTKPANCFVAINVDPHHIDDPPVRAVLDAHGDLGGIVFELTAHREIHDLSAARRTVDGLRRRGAVIAIDDASACRSTLDQILALKPQILKLDRELVNDLPAHEAKRTLIHILGEVASRIDAWVLAEGIETLPEVQSLVELGVPLGQGYYLGAPSAPWAELDNVPAEALAQGLYHRRFPTPGGALGAIMEAVSLCRGAEDWPRQARVAVRVDRTSRPIEMRVVGEDGPRLRMEYDLLRVNIATAIADAAVRAMSRPDRFRWDPLVCIDELGRFHGIVPMQRILSSLAQTVLASESVPMEAIVSSGHTHH